MLQLLNYTNTRMIEGMESSEENAKMTAEMKELAKQNAEQVMQGARQARVDGCTCEVLKAITVASSHSIFFQPTLRPTSHLELTTYLAFSFQTIFSTRFFKFGHDQETSRGKTGFPRLRSPLSSSRRHSCGHGGQVGREIILWFTLPLPLAQTAGTLRPGARLRKKLLEDAFRIEDPVTCRMYISYFVASDLCPVCGALPVDAFKETPLLMDYVSR